LDSEPEAGVMLAPSLLLDIISMRQINESYRRKR